MGKKEKRRAQEEEAEEAEVKEEQSLQVEDEGAERKRRKKEKKEKRRSVAASGSLQDEGVKEEAEEEEEAPRKKKKKEERKEKGSAVKEEEKEEGPVDEEAEESETAGPTANAEDDDDDTFDLSSLKKGNKSSTASSTSSSPSSSSSSIGEGSRVFLGNLPFKVTDELLVSHFASCGGSIEGLHYVTDKTTGKFYGSAFMDFSTPEAAAAALQLNGSSILGRAIKVGMATGIHSQGPNRYNSKQKNGGHLAAAPVSEKPEGTTTVFLGNLSFDVTEEAIREMFGGCGEIGQVRWVEKDGVFKGCGFIEFDSTEATDAAVKLNGAEMMGRPIRVDYSGGSSRRG